MGLGTILFKTFDGIESNGRPKVSDLFSPLHEKGIFVPFDHTFLLGNMNRGKTCRVLIFDEQSIPGMVRMSGDFAQVREPYFLAAKGFPESLRTPVDLQGYILEPEVVCPPSIFDLLAKDSPILMVSREFAQGFAEGMSNEAFLFLGDSQKGLIDLLQSIRATLDAEGFSRYELSSPMEWVGEMESLRDYRIKCQAFAGIALGLLILVTFGSIAVFEFRQNLYVLSLFKSFGVPAPFLFLRYLIDALVITVLSFAFAIKLGSHLHKELFEAMALSVRGFEQVMIDHFTIFENLELWIILLLAVIISMTPVAWALRIPVGKNLS